MLSILFSFLLTQELERTPIFIFPYKNKNSTKIKVIYPKDQIMIKKGQKQCLVIKIVNLDPSTKIKWKFIGNEIETRYKEADSTTTQISISSDKIGTRGLYIDARFNQNGKYYCAFQTVGIIVFDK